jgi:hypothetical protein
MKALMTYGLCLTLGLASATAFAQEAQWRPAAGRPVSLSRPVPAGNVTPVTLFTPLARGQAADDDKGPPLAPNKVEIKVVPSPRPVTTQTPGKDVEFITPLPKPAPAAAPKDPASSSVWGGLMPPGTIAGPVTDVAPGPLDADCGGDDCGQCKLLHRCGILKHVWGALHDHCWTANCAGSGCLPTGCFTDCCLTRPHFWVYGDYLLWFAKEQQVPSLVSVNPTGAAPVLGTPGTFSAFDRINNNPWSGIRVGTGFWFPNHDCWGLDASFFVLPTRSGTFTAGSAGVPSIGRPFINATTGLPTAELVALPGVVSGLARVDNDAQIWGMDFNLRRKLCCGPNYWLDGLIGYRHFYMAESLTITENLTVPGGPGAAPLGTILVQDRFATRNQFDGPQIGLAFQKRVGNRWFIGATTKVAIGVMHESVDIGGNTLFNFPGAGINSAQTGGLLALPTNIGRQSQDRFAVIPEVGVKFGFDVSPHLRLYAGYDFLYVSNVVRPAEQIDPVINRSQIPNAFGAQTLVGAPRPAPLFRTNDFFLHGVNFGLQYHY